MNRLRIVGAKQILEVDQPFKASSDETLHLTDGNSIVRSIFVKDSKNVFLRQAEYFRSCIEEGVIVDRDVQYSKWTSEVLERIKNLQF